MIELPSFYEQLKIDIVSYLGINADAVHIYLGLVPFLMIATAFRNRGLHIWMLIPVLLLSLGVEIADASHQLHTLGYIEWHKGFMDLVNTNLSPLVLFFLLRANRLPVQQEVPS